MRSLDFVSVVAPRNVGTGAGDDVLVTLVSGQIVLLTQI